MATSADRDAQRLEALKQGLAVGAQTAVQLGVIPYAPADRVRKEIMEGTPLQETLEAEVIAGPFGAQLWYCLKLTKPSRLPGFGPGFMARHEELDAQEAPSP